jgi:hypothetical protein
MKHLFSAFRTKNTKKSATALLFFLDYSPNSLQFSTVVLYWTFHWLLCHIRQKYVGDKTTKSPTSTQVKVLLSRNSPSWQGAVYTILRQIILLFIISR